MGEVLYFKKTKWFPRAVLPDGFLGRSSLIGFLKRIPGPAVIVEDAESIGSTVCNGAKNFSGKQPLPENTGQKHCETSHTRSNRRAARSPFRM